MESNWAQHNLQTIRTLMERSALYRRALAPIMFCAGFIGLAGAGAGLLLKAQTAAGFITFWAIICVVVMAAAFFIARRQALKESEPLWTPPTRRVAWAMAAPLFGGAAMTARVLFAAKNGGDLSAIMGVIPFWLLFYGCGLHSAGFFISRGVKILGLLFMLC